ncbi:hypothetical protein J4227_07050 [Candidatus Woesearchaeota archaeon]|nr:hypothetical protein [Candidatus Woesearchaeota archaeon]
MSADLMENRIFRSSQYYEGILQLRNPNDEIIGFILQEMEAKGDVYITKKIRAKNGIDVYVSSQHFLQNLGKKLKQKFGGKLKVSTRIHTRNRQRSKDVYRITVYYEAPLAGKNDVVLVENKVVKINVVGKTIIGINLGTGAKVTLNAKGLEMVKLEKHKTKVTTVRPRVEVLHPETYQSVGVENAKAENFGLEPGQNVTIVMHNGVYIV